MNNPEGVVLTQGWRATVGDDTANDGSAWGVARLHPGPMVQGDVFGLVDSLWSALTARGAKRVVLELDEVTFLGSSLLGEMVRLHKRLATAGGVLHLAALQPACYESLCLCRLNQVLPSYINRDEAMNKQS